MPQVFVGNVVVRFRLTVSLLRCRDVAGRTGLVEFFLWSLLLLSLVEFLSCGLRLSWAAAVVVVCSLSLLRSIALLLAVPVFRFVVALALLCSPTVAIAIFTGHSVSLFVLRSVAVVLLLVVEMVVAIAIFTVRSVAR
jgi:hypothetical protein